MKKVAIYTRVSSHSQVGEDKYGLAEQLDAIKEYCAANGLQLDSRHIYTDEAEMGGDMQRQGLMNMISASGEFDAVICNSIDRIARDLFGQLWVEKELLKTDTQIISVTEPNLFKDDKPETVLFRQIVAAFAEYEKKKITARMMGGKRQKAKNGGFTGGKVPFGYVSENGNLAVDNAKSNIITMIFGMYEESGSLSAVARKLNKKGVPTKNGGKWYPGTVKYILENPIYKGRMEICIDGKKFTKNVPHLAIA